MKVYIGKDGISGRAFNNKAQISHEVAPKDTLSKRSDGVISNKHVRTVGGNVEKPRGSSNTTAQKQHYGRNSAKLAREENKDNVIGIEKTKVGNMEKPHGFPNTEVRKQAHYGNGSSKFSKSENNSVAVGGKQSITQQGVPSVATQKQEHYSTRSVQTLSDKHKGVSPEGNRLLTTANSPKLQGASMPDARKRVHLAKKKLNIAPQGKYKILKNGVIGKTALTKRKIRVIGSKIAAKLQKAKLKKLKKQTVRYNREQAQLATFAMGGAAALKKKDISKAVGGAKKAVNIAKKPVESLKRQFYNQADKSDDSGVKAAKLGMQIKDYGTSSLKTAVRTGAKTVKNGSKITKRVYRKIHKPTSAELRRRLRKRVNHNLAAEAKFLAKRAIKNGTRAAGKAAANAAKTAAKSSAKAAAKAAQAAAKAAAAASKAVAGAVAKIAGLIAETMPWSLIIIAVIVLVVLIALMVGSLFTSAGGSVAGGGAWLVDDNKNETPEEIYEGYKEFVEQAKDIMQTQAKDALKDEVTGFCSSDTAEPRKIIQYVDKNNNLTYYPALGTDGSINALIEQFGTDDYADYMSLLFVLMTREKAQADGATDAEIYDFDFTKSDFEEFMKTVNDNSCRWGDTFVYKTAVETSPHACPGQDCKTEYIPGCECRCSWDRDDDGNWIPNYYCGGHPYCPVDHTKLTVKLYTVKDYYGKEYSEIYDFTENEKTRYEASKAIIQGMLEYWEG